MSKPATSRLGAMYQRKRSAAAAQQTGPAAAVAGGSGAERGYSNPWARFGWVMASIWLIFLFYPISAIVRSDRGLLWQIVAWVGLAVFVAVYLYSFRVGTEHDISGRSGVSVTQYVLLGVMIASIAATTPAIGFDATGFFPFLVSAAAYQFTRPLYWTLSAVCVAIVAVGVFTLRDGLEYIGLLGILAILVIVNAVSTWLIARSIDADELTLELATSEEREAVARDVHDLIGHSLTVLKLKAQLASRLIDADPERARAELEEMERIAGEALQGVRATVSGLRSSGLAEQLEAARGALSTAGVTLQVRGEVSSLSPAQALPASWILREAVTNVLRHAGASRVSVTLAPGEMIVEDDGVGPAGKPGNGVRGMAERAAVSGGACVMQPGSNGGTRVAVTW